MHGMPSKVGGAGFDSLCRCEFLLKNLGWNRRGLHLIDMMAGRDVCDPTHCCSPSPLTIAGTNQGEIAGVVCGRLLPQLIRFSAAGGRIQATRLEGRPRGLHADRRVNAQAPAGGRDRVHRVREELDRLERFVPLHRSVSDGGQCFIITLLC